MHSIFEHPTPNLALSHFRSIILGSAPQNGQGKSLSIIFTILNRWCGQVAHNYHVVTYATGRKSLERNTGALAAHHSINPYNNSIHPIAGTSPAPGDVCVILINHPIAGPLHPLFLDMSYSALSIVPG